MRCGVACALLCALTLLAACSSVDARTRRAGRHGAQARELARSGVPLADRPQAQQASNGDDYDYVYDPDLYTDEDENEEDENGNNQTLYKNLIIFI